MFEWFFSGWKLYATLIASVMALAVGMDKVATDELKKRLKEVMTGDYKLRRMSLSEFVIFYIENSFGRLFVGNHISSSNVAKSMLITVISMLTIVVLFAAINHVSPLSFFAFAQGRPYPLSFIYTAIVIAMVVLNDLFSFLQTAMFMRFAAGIKSFADMLFLAVCDLIVTVNIFVFVFPVALALVFKIDDLEGRKLALFTATEVYWDKTVKKEEKKQVEKNKDDATDEAGGEGDDEFERKLGELTFTKNQPLGKNFNEFQKKNDVRVDRHAIEPYVALRDGSLDNLIGTEIFSASKGVSAEEVQTALWKELGVTLKEEQPPKEKSRITQELRDSKKFYRGSIYLSDALRDHSVLVSYFTAYGLSHAVQDQFLFILRFQLVKQEIKDIVIRFSQPYLAIPKEDVGEFLLLCDGKRTFTNEIPDVTSCKNSFSVSYVGPALREAYYWARVFYPPMAPIVVSVFASTGLFIAILFYCSLILYVASGLILKTAWGLGVGRGWFDIEKNPFTVSAGVIIAAGIPIGWLVATMISRFI